MRSDNKPWPQMSGSGRSREGGTPRRHSILIVTEDAKGGHHYIEDLGKYCKLPDVGYELDVQVTSSTDPKGLVNYTKKFAQNGGGSLTTYDKIYCVFDGDKFLSGGNHQSSFRTALDLCQGAKLMRDEGGRRPIPVPIQPIISTPCFEVWLLLHFLDSVPPFQKTVREGREGYCNGAISQLNAQFKLLKFSNYNKGDHYPFDTVFQPNLPKAVQRAKRLSQDAQLTAPPNTPAGLNNPETMMFQLVEELHAIVEANTRRVRR